MVRFRSKVEVRGAPVVNLPGHHAQCEMNYHLCLSLIPGCREGRQQWSFTLGDQPAVPVEVNLVESAPYTSTIDILQNRNIEPYVVRPKIRVRLYHDVAMAEVVGWDHHRHWLPVYSYPNRRMYQPDEKQALNRFFGEWLLHCRKLGIACDGFCEYSRITKK